MFTFEIRKPSVAEYQALRKTTGWSFIEDDRVQTALQNDLFSIVVLDREKPIGMGRVIGDGAIYFYIQDIIVLPKYQGKGIGRLIMDQIEIYLNQAARRNAFIALMAADGVKGFYQKYGFVERPANGPGMYKRIS